MTEASVVTIDTGKLSSKTSTISSGKTINFFGGIPYAAAPIANLRWAAPTVPDSWEGVRDASDYGPSCPQLVVGEGGFRDAIASALGGELPEPETLEYDEDCLFLNVYTPNLDNTANLPVLFWVHGGAHRFGSSSSYPGEKLAEKGVVLVTINYRLGPLGFVSHPELTAQGCKGNQGLLDTVAALEWVQRNVRQFGGNPDNVTVFGESAGGHSTCALVASPLCKGLIHGAIAQSGVGAQAVQLLDQPGAIPVSAEDTGVSLGEVLGCPAGPGQLDAMRKVSTDEIIRLTAQFPLPGVIIDGHCQVDNPITVIREGQQNDIPLMIGSNAYEGSALYWGAPMAQMQLCPDVDSYLAEFDRFFEEDAEEAIRLYPAGDNEEMIESSKQMCGDSLFGAPTRAVSQALSEQDKSCYAYYFTQTPAADESGVLGAFHAMEISYVFGQDFLSPLETNDDLNLSEMMMSYWVNFATNGNPNGQGLPIWDQFNSNADQMMEFGKHTGMAPVALADKYNVVMKGLDKQLAAVKQS